MAVLFSGNPLGCPLHVYMFSLRSENQTCSISANPELSEYGGEGGTCTWLFQMARFCADMEIIHLLFTNLEIPIDKLNFGDPWRFWDMPPQTHSLVIGNWHTVFYTDSETDIPYHSQQSLSKFSAEIPHKFL